MATITPTSQPTVSNGQTGAIANINSAWDAIDLLTALFSGWDSVSDKAVKQGALVLCPQDQAFGAVGNGVADDTAAVVACFAAAKAARRTGLTGTILHPGATVVLKGRYNLATLAGPITVSCNVLGSTAELIIPAAYADTVLLVGHETSGSILQSADIDLPDVVTTNTVGPLTGSSVGVKVQNLYSSRLNFGRVAYVETGIWLTGLGEGTVYNRVYLGWVSYAKVAVKLLPGTAGWVNQNTFVGGGIQQSSGFDGGGYRRTGWKHLQLDGAAVAGVNGNTFVGYSLEGDVSAIAIDIRRASQTTFVGMRSEPGRAGRTVTTTASSATIGLTAHALAVNDMVVFAGTLPAALNINVPYFVVSVIDADNFTVSAAKGGTAITIATTTSTGLIYQPHRVSIDTTTYSTTEIHFIDTVATLKTLEFVVSGTSYEGITQDSHNQRTLDPYQDADRPLFRARNRNAAAIRALFATYAPTINPADDPLNWSTALSDRGLLIGASRAEIGRLWAAPLGAAAATLLYRTPTDSVDFEVASCRRSPSLIAITSLSCAANTTTSTNITLTGASVRDHVVITPDGALNAGLILSDARVSSANTITVTFGNLTGSTITLTQNFQAVAFRRFL